MAAILSTSSQSVGSAVVQGDRSKSNVCRSQGADGNAQHGLHGLDFKTGAGDRLMLAAGLVCSTSEQFPSRYAATKCEAYLRRSKLGHVCRMPPQSSACLRNMDAWSPCTSQLRLYSALPSRTMSQLFSDNYIRCCCRRIVFN